MKELGTIVKTRREILGLSRLSIAQDIGTTPNMLANFEENISTLRPDLLAKCLNRLGIDISMYDERANLAGYTATLLMSKGISVERLMTMDKYQLAKETELPRIKYLLDMTEKDQQNIIDIQESGLVSFEGTYIHFRSLVAYMMNSGSNPNSPRAQKGRDEAFRTIQELAQKSNPNKEKTKELIDKIENHSFSDNNQHSSNSKNQKPRRTGADGLFSNSVGKNIFGMSLLALAVSGIVYTLGGQKK